MLYLELETLLVSFPASSRSLCINILEKFNSIFIFGDKNEAALRASSVCNVLVFALAPEVRRGREEREGGEGAGRRGREEREEGEEGGRRGREAKGRG
jgi:hypothetical protein